MSEATPRMCVGDMNGYHTNKNIQVFLFRNKLYLHIRKCSCVKFDEVLTILSTIKFLLHPRHKASISLKIFNMYFL